MKVTMTNSIMTGKNIKAINTEYDRLGIVMKNIIITCNAGSTNTKFAVFNAKTLERIEHKTSYQADETAQWLSSVGSLGTLVSIGHRVVHGGQDFTQPELITPDILAKIKSYTKLAPLHQPSAIKIIEKAQKLYSDVPHIACFDTAFHHTMPEIQKRYALPQSYYDEGVFRYGFHGLSYEHIATTMPEHERVIVAHLGGGASACAMHNRKSIATTMGFSTLNGLMMGTRCGSIDPGVLLYLLQQKNMTPDELSNLLYHESGLSGVSGTNGIMHELLASKATEAKLAVELFCTMAAREIAALVPSLGGLDAIVFTGGIGENATPVRDKIVELLKWIGDFPVHVIPADEELVIAKACRKNQEK